MRVLVTGATGFVGRAVVARLLGDGHAVSASVRSPARGASMLGPEVHLVSAREGHSALAAALTRADAVINLAGENVMGGRWTASRMRALRDSRVQQTADLVQTMASSHPRPAVLISASAVGFYGDAGDVELDEQHPRGAGFLAQLCEDWENAAMKAESSGVRVAVLRIGVVLGPEGGALHRLLPLFRAGLGGRLGSGRQWVPWIHLRDLVELISTTLGDVRFRGVVNGTAPNPVTNAELTAALARVLHKPAILPVPALAMQAALGQAASVLLSSQRVLPRQLSTLGFSFHYPHLETALHSIVDAMHEVRIEPVLAIPPAMSDGPAPCYMLRHRLEVEAPVDKVFAFFSNAGNLALLTPSWTDFRFVGPPPSETRAGLIIDYTLRIGGIPVRWRTRIVQWSPGQGFVDEQVRGPYRRWWHEHVFTAHGNRTVIQDRVYYALPFGPLGRIVHAAYVSGLLKRIFAYRKQAVALRLGSILDAPATSTDDALPPPHIS